MRRVLHVEGLCQKLQQGARTLVDPPFELVLDAIAIDYTWWVSYDPICYLEWWECPDEVGDQAGEQRRRRRVSRLILLRHVIKHEVDLGYRISYERDGSPQGGCNACAPVECAQEWVENFFHGESLYMNSASFVPETLAVEIVRYFLHTTEAYPDVEWVRGLAEMRYDLPQPNPQSRKKKPKKPRE